MIPRELRPDELDQRAGAIEQLCEHYSQRFGIVAGATPFLLYARPIVGRKYASLLLSSFITFFLFFFLYSTYLTLENFLSFIFLIE